MPFPDPVAGGFQPPGPAGASAYDQWLGQGNAGSLADFLAQLKGEPGAPSTVPGPRGLTGPPGAGSITTRTARGVVPAWTAVVPDGESYCLPADPDDPTHKGLVLGVTALGGATGSLVAIQCAGDLDGPAGAWTGTQLLYVGPGGTLTPSPPASGWLQVVAVASSGSHIVVSLGVAESITPSGSAPGTPPGSAGYGLRTAATTLPAATTVDLGRTLTPEVTITGTSAIASFGRVPEMVRLVRVAGAATLVHDPVWLALPGAADIAAQPGDSLVATSDTGGRWTVRSYQRASGKALVAPAAADVAYRAAYPGAIARTAYDLLAARLRGSDAGLRSTYQDAEPADAAPAVQRLIEAVGAGQTRAIDLDVPGYLNVASTAAGVAGRLIVLRAEPGVAYGGAIGLRGLAYDLYEGYEPAAFNGAAVTRTYRFGDRLLDPSWHAPTWERGRFRVSTVLDFPGITLADQATEWGGLFMAYAPDISIRQDQLGIPYDPNNKFCEKDALVGWSRTEAGANIQVVGVRGYNEIATPGIAANGRQNNAGIGWGMNAVHHVLDGAIGYSLGLEINGRQASNKATAKPGGYDSIGLKFVTVGTGDHCTAAIYIQQFTKNYYNGLICDQGAIVDDPRARFIELSSVANGVRTPVYAIDRLGSHLAPTWGIDTPTGYARFRTVAAETLRVGPTGADRKVVSKALSALAPTDLVLILE